MNHDEFMNRGNNVPVFFRFFVRMEIGDQSASMWGSCCFNVGDIKITLGTGSFLNLNTGAQCNASIYGLYPLVAWKYKDKQSTNSELVYCMEGAANDTGSIIQWAINFGWYHLLFPFSIGGSANLFSEEKQSLKSICVRHFSGLFEDPSKSSDIANSVDDTEEVYFIPAFSGLGVRSNHFEHLLRQRKSQT